MAIGYRILEVLVDYLMPDPRKNKDIWKVFGSSRAFLDGSMNISDEPGKTVLRFLKARQLDGGGSKITSLESTENEGIKEL